MKHSLYIILLNWNNAKRTLKCLKSLSKWNNLQVKIIIVDNNSKTKDQLVLQKNIRADQLIFNPINGGFAGGNNLGIKKAMRSKVDFILLLNTDAIVSENDIIQLIEQLKKNPKIGAIGPAIREGSKKQYKFLVGGRNIAYFSFTRIQKKQEELSQLPNYPLHFVDYVSGTIFLSRVECFQKVGLLNNNYFFSGEIADFCQRLKKWDYQTAVDVTVVAQHYTDQTDSQLRNELYTYYNIRNRFLFIEQHYPQKKIRLMLFWVIQGLRQIPGIVWNKNWRQLRAIVLGIWHGLKGHFGNQNASFLNHS